MMLSKRLYAAFAVVLLLASTGCKIDGTEGEVVDNRDPFVPPTPPDPYIPTPPGPTAKKIVLLHTNDEHSHLLGFSPNSVYPFKPKFDANGAFSAQDTAVAIATQLATAPDTETVGGVVRRQFVINRERAAAAAEGNPVLLLSGGDVMMGTVFHAAYALGQAPDYIAMAVMGYDFATIGNHGFDFGADVLASAVNNAHQMTFGGAVPLVASNIHFDDVQVGGTGAALHSMYGEGDSGAPIMPWATKTLKNGLKVGFVGLLGYQAALVAPGKSPVYFSTPRTGAACTQTTTCTGSLDACLGGVCVDPLDANGHVMALVGETQMTVNTLRAEGVDLVVVLAHLGTAEEEVLAASTTGIDVIIGAHSHDIAPARMVGSTILTQAGGYGAKLGKLVVTVGIDGKVGFDQTASEILEIDHTLDAQIFGDTDLANGHISKSLEEALALTGGVIAPVLAGLDAALAPNIGLTSLLDTVAMSDHDVIGEQEYKDTYLSHLVTDAERLLYLGQTCHMEAGGPPVVGVQAHGVIRESLRFSTPTGTSTVGTVAFSDVFRVLPLGASPFEGAMAAPGYPMVMFSISAIELLAGANIGATEGLDNNDFFLSYSGMRVEYDTRRPDFDPTAPNPVATGPIVKMELSDGTPNGYWTLFDATVANPQMAFTDPTGTPMDPTTFLVSVVTNLYLAGFLEQFGITPRDFTGAPLPGEGTARLAQTALCHTGMPKDCLTGSVSMVQCMQVGAPPWAAPEVKEWQMLLGYLTNALGGTIPTGLYQGETVAEPLLRVKNVTP